MLSLLAILVGCETDSFIDPSRTGYFETTPSAMPILGRIDVIEQAGDLPDFVEPTREMLQPSTSQYTFSPGDVLSISIPNLMRTGETERSERIIDQSGLIQLPVIGKIAAAGKTVEVLENDITERLKDIITNPQVFVALTEGRTFQYRVLGSVAQPGLFALPKPDFRLLDALATAQGASVNTTRILITRTTLEEEFKPEYDRKSPKDEASKQDKSASNSEQPSTKNPNDSITPTQTNSAVPEVDIDKLINELPTPTSPTVRPVVEPPASESAPVVPASASAQPTPSEPTPAEPAPAQPAEPPIADPTSAPNKKTQLGMLRASNRQAPPVDIDQLDQANSAEVTAGNSTPSSAVSEEITGDQFVYDPVSQAFVRKSATKTAAPEETSPDTIPPAENAGVDLAAQGGNAGLRAVENAQIKKKNNLQVKKENTVVIEIKYNSLVQGDSKLNIVILPGDAIYCDSGEVGVVYIDGEISRPGVYNMPTSGRLTLSRLVAAAGGVSELAIPERCDLIRRLGSDKEACVRISLLAIRNRGEPDVFLKPDDHIIVGTNFWALPLSRLRRDLSFPNSVGFQLDRNFGNDVFGAPPQNFNTN